MPERGKATTSAPRFIEGRRRSKQTVAERLDEDHRATLIERVILIGTVFSIGTIGLYVLLYFQTGIWQILADGGGLVLGLVCLALAHCSARRGKLDAAGYWLLLTLVIAYGASELAWADETLFNTVGGISLIFLVGSIVLPRKWEAWLITTGLYITYVFLVNQFEPLPRLDANDAGGKLTALFFFDLGLTVALALSALWLIVRALRTGTIRTRLLIAFVAVTLLPVTFITIGVVAWGGQNDRRAVINQLESVATLKNGAIETWLATLQTDLAAVLTGEDTTQHALVLLRESPNLEPYQDAHSELQRHFLQVVEQTQRFERLFLMDLQGRVVLSTDAAQEGKNYFGFTFFQRGLDGAQAHITWEWNQLWLASVHPIADEHGQVLGVLAGRTSLTTLNEIMLERTGLGDTGETYLVNAERAVLTELRSGERIPYMPAEGIYAAIAEEQASGSDVYDNYHGVPVVGVYHWLPELGIALLTEQHQAEASRDANASLVAVGVTALVAVLIAVIASLFITRSIANPLANLAETATHVAAGDLERVAKVEQADEIGSLAQAFNSMTAQLRNLIDSLEQRVAERTRQLEQRSAYLEASAEVGHVATSILEIDRLIRQVVELIRERFGLYYVGLFLVDEAGEWAVLQAGTGEAGQAMLARGHRIKVGEGMIGWSVTHAQARVALEAGEDAVRLATAELPDTRSEAALPLRSRGQVIGALTVQSEQPGAFDQDTIVVLQTMSDQVAVALDNARLFTESQAALEAASRAYGELSREAWVELLRARPDLGYRSGERGVTSARDIWRPEMEQALQEGKAVQGKGLSRAEGAKDGGTNTDAKLPLAVPIRVRDNVIGVLDTYKPGAAGGWTPEEIALLETLADQLGAALESARLYEDAQRRAARERLTREITDRMRRATNVEGIVQTVVDELFSVMGTSRAFVRLGAASSAPATSTRSGKTTGKTVTSDD